MREQMSIEFSLHNSSALWWRKPLGLLHGIMSTVVLFDDSRKSWVVQFVMNRMNDSYVSPTQEIDPHQSLVGGVIQSGYSQDHRFDGRD